MIKIYTDGSALGNPGKGGYGIIMKLENSNYEKSFSEGFRLTTNNRMELLAVIVALEKIKYPDQKVILYSDSKYVIDAINKNWLNLWLKRGFKQVKNTDLWQRFLKVYSTQNVIFEWIKGHAGHPENERCDQLAAQAAQGSLLSIDKGYENSLNNQNLL